MTLTADDLVKHLAALSRRFAGLAAKLAQAARELETGGVLPPESLIEELAAARDEFIDLRSSVLDAARTLAVTAPAQTAIDGLKALEAVVRALAEATAHESRRTTLADARRRVLAVLDRIMTINHVDDPNFAALLECQAKAREIRAAVLDPKGPTEESAAEILETTPAFSALLTLVEGREHLDDAKFAVLEDSVTRLFGRTLTVAATRGKLVAGPAARIVSRGATRTTGAAARTPTVSACARKARGCRGRRGARGRQRVAGRRDCGPGRGRPVVGLGVGAVDELEGHHRLQGGRETGAREVRVPPECPDPAVRRLRGGASGLRPLDPPRFPRSSEPRDPDQGSQPPDS